MTSVDPSAPPTPSQLPEPVLPVQHRKTTGTPQAAPVVPAPRPPEAHGLLARVRAWMVVLPVDAVLLAAPAIWAPQQWRAHVAMTALGVVLLTGGSRYRARLHLSVLDELPTLLGRLLTAAAIVATVIALRHEQDSVTTFLVNAAAAIGLVLVGRTGTTCLAAAGRRRRVIQHRTVLIGGGGLAAELTEILRRHPRYGLSVVGFVDDGTDCVAEAVMPQLGRLAD